MAPEIVCNIFIHFELERQEEKKTFNMDSIILSKDSQFTILFLFSHNYYSISPWPTQQVSSYLKGKAGLGDLGLWVGVLGATIVRL